MLELLLTKAPQSPATSLCVIIQMCVCVCVCAQDCVFSSVVSLPFVPLSGESMFTQHGL